MLASSAHLVHKEIITALRQLFRYTKSSATAELFVIVGAFIERPRATDGRPYEYLLSHFQRIQSQEPLIYRARFALIKKGGSTYMLSRLVCANVV